MITQMVLPQVSITSAEVKLLSWLKKPGDSVKRGESVVEVETEKANVEIESYVDGYFRVANFPEGASVPIDAVIAILSTTLDENIADLPFRTEGSKSNLETLAPSNNPILASGSEKMSRIDISPVAKNLAEEKQIDISTIMGSGPGGRIVRSDVEEAIQSRGMVSGREEKEGSPTIPASTPSAMRNAIAQRTTLSKASIPHYYVSIDIDMQVALALVSKLKKIADERKIEAPTLTDVIIWASGQILPKYPALHGSWSDKGPMINPDINIGIVVGLEDGLIVPIVHQVDTMNLRTLAGKTHDLKQKAKGGGLSNLDLTGGTFTISNLGMFGINSFIAVINPPESAILALGATIKRAIVNNKDEIIIRPVMSATLSVDHRVVDGILAAKFLNSFKEFLEEPSLLLIDL
jgi:pyruvate dehydrogenase E2 component (dihydrolipoamide acetyltransferase)